MNRSTPQTRRIRDRWPSPLSFTTPRVSFCTFPHAPILQEVGGSRLRWHKAPQPTDSLRTPLALDRSAPLVAPVVDVAGTLVSAAPCPRFAGDELSPNEYRVKAAAARHLYVTAEDAVTRDCKHVYIGRETPRMRLRRSVSANSHKIDSDVDRK